jgi:hypothetical protein
MSSCTDCGGDVAQYIDHCHGTLIVHSDRSLECTDPACQLPELLRHDLIIDCMAVFGGCCADGVLTDSPSVDLTVAS